MDEIPTNNDVLGRIEGMSAPHGFIDLQNMGEPKITQAEPSAAGENIFDNKFSKNKSTDDEGQIGGVNEEQIGGAKAF